MPQRVGGTRTRRSRRPLTVFVLVIAVVGVFVFRLVDVQVVQAAGLTAESTARRSVDTVVPGLRGTITDASGTVLASSVARFQIVASPKLAAAEARTAPRADAGRSSVAARAARLAAATGLSAPALTKALSHDPSSQYLMVVPAATLAVLNRVKALDIDWLFYTQLQQRSYPNGAVAGNLVGFVGADGSAQSGTEYGENACLKGTDGRTSTEQGQDGTPIPGTAVSTRPAKQGGSVTLTIDRDLQWFAQQTLATRAKQVGAASGSVVVSEVATGRLLAIADWPTVDPGNVPATANTDPEALGSRAFQAPFEPGSTMKSVTTAALLDAGLITPTTQVVAPFRYTNARGADVHDSEAHGDLHLTATGVLIQSSNTGISQLGLRMSDAARYGYLQRFGFGRSTGTGYPAEASGGLGAHAPHWDGQSEVATMFGQGLTATAVQMASAYSTIANGGVKLPVSLIERCTAADGTVTTPARAAPKRIVSAKAAHQTVQMLENVATKGWLAAKVTIPGYRVGIKTGTAQESDGHGGYAPGFLVSMAGIAPAESPKYVVYVDLNDARKLNTAQAVAPVFQKVMARVLQQHGVVPSGTHSPDLPEYW